MFVIICIVVLFACVLGGYVAMGGKIDVLWQPFEVVIIVGAAIGAVIVGNTKNNLGRIGKGFGKLMGGAPVGTFLGVFVAYGMVGLIVQVLNAVHDSETKYYNCLKAGILAYLNGYAPAFCVEFARKALESNVRPSFYEVEEAVGALPAVGCARSRNPYHGGGRTRTDYRQEGRLGRPRSR